MTMDAAKLRKSIDCVRTGLPWTELSHADLEALADAAEAHLATLPRTRPMWFVIWRDTDGFFYCADYTHADHAKIASKELRGVFIATVGPYEVPDNG